MEAIDDSKKYPHSVAFWACFHPAFSYQHMSSAVVRNFLCWHFSCELLPMINFSFMQKVFWTFLLTVLVFFLLLIPDFISPGKSLKKVFPWCSIRPHIYIRLYFCFYLATTLYCRMQVWCHWLYTIWEANQLFHCLALKEFLCSDIFLDLQGLRIFITLETGKRSLLIS